MCTMELHNFKINGWNRKKSYRVPAPTFQQTNTSYFFSYVHLSFKSLDSCAAFGVPIEARKERSQGGGIKA